MGEWHLTWGFPGLKIQDSACYITGLYVRYVNVSETQSSSNYWTNSISSFSLAVFLYCHARCKTEKVVLVAMVTKQTPQ